MKWRGSLRSGQRPEVRPAYRDIDAFTLLFVRTFTLVFVRSSATPDGQNFGGGKRGTQTNSGTVSTCYKLLLFAPQLPPQDGVAGAMLAAGPQGTAGANLIRLS